MTTSDSVHISHETPNIKKVSSNPKNKTERDK